MRLSFAVAFLLVSACDGRGRTCGAFIESGLCQCHGVTVPKSTTMNASDARSSGCNAIVDGDMKACAELGP